MITIISHFPSPYQVEFFDAIHKELKGQLRVLYLYRRDPARSWGASKIEHEHNYIYADGFNHRQAKAWVLESELTVFNYYNDSRVLRLIDVCHERDRAWVLWGERPGYQHPFLGRLLRYIRLRSLRVSMAPIWGIGNFAVAAYQREFGLRRRYFNIPYFSNIERFQSEARRQNRDERVVLYSGSLIYRKGVDLLAKAFSQIARENPQLQLHFMGDGELKGHLMRELAPWGERVKFIGFKDWHELPEIYSKADFLCVPSRYDGWGLVVPEGLASGLPIIGTTRMGAALDLIRDGENGWMSEAGDAESLTQALQSAARITKSRLEAMSKNAVESIRCHQLNDGVRRFLDAVESSIHQHWKPAKQTIIHFWSPDLNPTSGGIGAYSQILSLSLQRYPNLSLRLFPKERKGLRPDRLYSFPWHGLKNKFLRSMGYALILLYWSWRERPDLIITTHVNLSPVARLIRCCFGIRYAISLHGIDVWNLKNASRVMALREADFLLPVSHYTQQIVAKEQKIDDDRFFVLPDTVDPKRFQIGSKNEEILKRYSITREKKIVLTVCRLSRAERYKGYDRILRNWSKILKAVPDAHYLLVGSGDDEQHIAQIIYEEGIENSVTLAGFIPAHELPYYYQLADVFAMPSSGEGFGIVFLEALASGLPVLAGNQDASREPLLNGEIGVLIDPKDDTALVDALVLILRRSHPNHEIFKPDIVRKKVIQAYGLEAFQQKLTSFLQRLHLI